MKPTFETYDERIAEGLIASQEDGSGLNGWLGIRLREVWPGGLRAVLPVRSELLTPFGNLHGGVLAAFCDHLLGTVFYPVMPPGAWAATTEFKLNYLAPVRTGELDATTTIVALSKRTGVARSEVANEGRPVCLAQGTVLVMPPKVEAGGRSG